MKLHVHEIQDARILTTTAQIPAASIPFDLPDQPVLTEPVVLRIRAEAFENEVLVLAEISARARLVCSRCVERYEEKPLDTQFELRVPLTHSEVDLLEETRQSLVLALPFKPLCREKCLGLCPQCGRNLNQGLCGCRQDKGEKPFAKLKDFKIS